MTAPTGPATRRPTRRLPQAIPRFLPDAAADVPSLPDAAADVPSLPDAQPDAASDARPDLATVELPPDAAIEAVYPDVATSDTSPVSTCELAAATPSSVGCEFWAVDLDQQDMVGDPASAAWGVVLASAAQDAVEVTIELNEAPVGQPPVPTLVDTVLLAPGGLEAVVLPTRELDCGITPNDYASPGTCLSSRAYRIRATAPIVAYQFNVFDNAYSNDASLLLPSSALGTHYRVLGWSAGHPILIDLPGTPKIVYRSFVTIVGTQPDTQVVVKPSWRIKGNPPIAAQAPGGEVTVTLGPFDVLNLETDDATIQDEVPTMADLSGSEVTASKPVAVFSGSESTGVPGVFSTNVPKPPSWSGEMCCYDHLEDQLVPAQAVGRHYVVARSPVRSTGHFREPDILRFVGVDEEAVVTTSLPPPFDSFSLAPGEVKTTWTQNDVVIEATRPVLVGQLLVGGALCEGPQFGDPSLTVMPSVEQFRSSYRILSPGGWEQSWIVIAAEVGAEPTLDGTSPTDCVVESAGVVQSTSYRSMRCPVGEGVHELSADKPFGVVAYGYGSAGSYALVAGMNVTSIIAPPVE